MTYWFLAGDNNIWKPCNFGLLADLHSRFDLFHVCLIFCTYFACSIEALDPGLESGPMKSVSSGDCENRHNPPRHRARPADCEEEESLDYSQHFRNPQLFHLLLLFRPELYLLPLTWCWIGFVDVIRVSCHSVELIGFVNVKRVFCH